VEFYTSPIKELLRVCQKLLNIRLINKLVEIIIILLFGFAFLVYLFPVIFVEGAKLQSGVTVTAPATTETEKICNDTIDNDNDGKIDAADEDCAGAPTGRTCGLQIVGVPINYGQLNPGDESSPQTVFIRNVGPAVAKILVNGGDWVSNEPGNLTVFGPEITHVSKQYNYYNSPGQTALKSNAIELGTLIPGGLLLYFQVRIPVSSFSGSLHQELSIDLICP